MTLEQYTNWEQFRNKEGNKVTSKEFEMIARYYSEVYRKKYQKPSCTSCNFKTYQRWINELNAHFESIEKPTE